MRQEFDFDIIAHSVPILFLQQGRLEFAQLRPRCPHEVVRAARPQKLKIGVADHPAIHHPDPLRLTVLGLHRRHDLRQRGHVGAVAREHFIRQRQTLGTDHQPQAYLRTIGPVIARIPARGLGVAGRLALKERAGHIVDQKLEAHAKPTLVARQQMLAKRLLVPVHRIEGAIQPVVVDLRPRQPQQVFQRRALIPAFSHAQFARLRVEAGDGQRADHRFPQQVFPTGRDQLAQQRV